MSDSYPKFKVAAVQAEPVALEREATVQKACSLIEEAGRNGARVIALPETFIPGHPEWLSFYPPGESMARFYRAFFNNSVEVPSPTTQRLGQAARKAGAYVAIGINERVPGSMGSLYNSLLFLDPEGKVLGVHRKLVPTRTERLVHAAGDGSTLNVYPTRYGGLGGLLCGENTNSLARFALLAQGEKIHTAHWPSFPTRHSRDGLDGIDIRIRYHAYEGKIFVVSASAVFGKSSIERLCKSEASRSLVEPGGSVSAIIDPYGKHIAGPLFDEEGILYADVDLELMIDAKTLHDVVGNYNRFDVLSLLYRRSSPKPLILLDETPAREAQSHSALLKALLKSFETAAELPGTPEGMELPDDPGSKKIS
ncbi:MAG: carbon-nitrogen hydrolase family protein [Burkholderiales bacterium]|nr:carbon-nitrogen hydrolase family protein [Burkholderiales bacterium]